MQYFGGTPFGQVSEILAWAHVVRPTAEWCHDLHGSVYHNDLKVCPWLKLNRGCGFSLTDFQHPLGKMSITG